MITSGVLQIVSGLFGLFSGSVSRGLDIWNQKVSNAHELAIRESERQTLVLQNELLLKRVNAEAGARMDEVYYKTVAEEIDAARANWTAVTKDMFQPTGIAWLDTINRAIRPLTMVFTILMFFGTLIAWLLGVPLNAEFGASMGTMFTEMAYASIYFYFGYRAIPKPPSRD